MSECHSEVLAFVATIVFKCFMPLQYVLLSTVMFQWKLTISWHLSVGENDFVVMSVCCSERHLTSCAVSHHNSCTRHVWVMFSYSCCLATVGKQGHNQRGHGPPIVDWVFFKRKNWLCWDVGPAALSTRSVLWASNMPKMCWRPRLCPGPCWGSHHALPDPRGRHSLLNLHSSRCLDSRTFGARLLLPQCKILATPLGASC